MFEGVKQRATITGVADDFDTMTIQDFAVLDESQVLIELATLAKITVPTA